MIDTALTQELIELISLSFNASEINEIGNIMFKKFDLHEISGTRHTLTVNTRKAASILAGHCHTNNQIYKLIEFMIQMDGSLFRGNTVEINNLEVFLNKLAHSGLVYNHKKRKIVPLKHSLEDAPDWGVLRDGKVYPFSVVSIDITGNSALVKKFGSGKMQKLYARLWTYLKSRLAPYNGRIWSWAGDGGLIAFTFKNHLWNAVKFAIETQATLPLFYSENHYPIKEPIKLRFGLDSGKIQFRYNTGSMVSEVINYACHLEKQVCEPGKVAVSDIIYKDTPKIITSCFEKHSVFEERPAFLSSKKIDSLYQ